MNAGKKSAAEWMDWVNLVLGLGLLIKGVQRFMATGPGLWTFVVLGVGLYGLISAGLGFRKKSKRERESLEDDPANASSADPDDEGPVRSLVYFLDEPRRIEGSEWMGHVGEALGVDLTPGQKEAVNFIMEMPHPVLTPQGDDCYMLKIPSGVFWIFHVKRPYFQDLKGWGARVRDQRLREAVEGHLAWISVDLLTWLDGPMEPGRVYAEIGRIMGALAGPDVRVVYAPELNRANEFDPILLPRLTGGDPLSLFADPTFAPVLHAADDDEQMEAAMEEARRRWPEFVACFESRDPGPERPYLVKAPFTSGGNTEHMWVFVTGLEDGLICGTLANQPHHLVDYHEGQSVRIPPGDLSDWLCADRNNRPLGGWTQKVLHAQQGRRS